MLVIEITVECPICEDTVSVPFSNVELEMSDDIDPHPLMSFMCPSCSQWVTGEPVDYE
jgi:hypothetical protein